MEPSFWRERWSIGRIGFHQSRVNPNLVEWWDHVGLDSDQQILVPLCGKSLDLHWLASRHATVGVEVVEEAVEAFWNEAELTPSRDQIGPYARSRSEGLTMLCGDFMALTPEHAGSIDGFYDRASFIAMPPALRGAYVETLSRVLKPGARGLVVTLEYDQTGVDGPPFSTSENTLKNALGTGFQVTRFGSRDAWDPDGGLADRGVKSVDEHVFEVVKIHSQDGEP